MANSHTLQFYLDRVEESRAQADAAELTHVRDRCQRAQAAWSRLASQMAATEKRRQLQEQAKAEALSAA